MKKRLVVIFVLLAALKTNAQLYDAQWALGYGESVVDFRDSTMVKIDSLPTLQYFTYTNASICDENGVLLYYTNGINICNVDSVLSNSSLCNCSSSDSLDGLNMPQVTLFIPKPGSTRYYYLFHCAKDTFQSSRPANLYYSLIDREGNNGKGKILQSNINILSGNALRGGGLTACKHANGRDYWLVMGASGINTFYKFLITPDSVLGPYTQSIGPDFSGDYDLAYSKFSLDGSKYTTGILLYSPILVMNFDRCSGEFSSPLTIYNNASTDPINNPASGCAAVEFSPNSRFVYASGNINLVQYDLLARHDSVQLFLEDSSTWYGIGFVQLAANGKIYGSTWNGGLSALHVITNPDLKGDSAGFVYGGQPTYSIASINVPNLINYRLGPLVGSGCDTLGTTDTTKTGVGIVELSANTLLRILPNPANKYAYVEMGMQGNYEFDLLNAAGQVIATKETPQVDIFDTEQIAAGTYLIRVIDKTTGAEVAIKKLVVVH